MHHLFYFAFIIAYFIHILNDIIEELTTQGDVSDQNLFKE